MILRVATWGSGDTKGRRPRPDEQPVVADPMLAELPLNQLESPRRFEQLVCDLAVQVHHLRKPGKIWIVTFGIFATSARQRIWTAMTSGDPTSRYSANSSTTNDALGGSPRSRTRCSLAMRLASRVATASAVAPSDVSSSARA